MDTKDEYFSYLSTAREVYFSVLQMSPVSPFADLSEVIEGFMFLGAQKDASNYPLLEAYEIKNVLSLCHTHPHLTNVRIPEHINFLGIPAIDFEDYDISQHFEECFQFLDKVHAAKQKVVVHCWAGVSRSPTIVLAYLMRSKGMKLPEALKLVRDRRNIIAPNEGFLARLMVLEKKLCFFYGARATAFTSIKRWGFGSWCTAMVVRVGPLWASNNLLYTLFIST